MTLELTGVRELSIYYTGVGDNVIPAAARAMGETVEFLRAVVVDEKLAGEALNVRSGGLQHAIVTTVESVSEEIVGTVMVDPASPAARYGAVHEFGGIYEIPEHLSHSRLGNEFTVRAHEANFPERSFLRSALVESDDALGQVFAARFLKELHA